MRKQIVANKDLAQASDFLVAGSEEEVMELCPWACRVVEVEGGWMAFEDLDEYEVWANQN